MGAEKGTKERHRRRRPAKKKEERSHGATDRNTSGQEEATQRRGPKDWPATGPSGLEQPGHERRRAANGAHWTGTSGGARRQGDKHKEPGLDHPGKKIPAGNRVTRTGSSGGLNTGTGTTGDEEGVARERRVKGGAENKKSGRPVKENMNKSKGWKGEETKNTNREERREGDEGAARKETSGEAGRRKKEGTVSRLEHPGPGRSHTATGPPGLQHPGGQADKRTEPGLEHPGKKRTRTRTSGAEALDWNVRGRSGPGLERPGLHQEEEATAARRKGKENMNKSKVQRREDTKNKSRDDGGEGEDRVQRQPAKHEGEGRKAWCLGLEHAGPGRGHTAPRPPGLEQPGRPKRTRSQSPTGTSGEERAGRQQGHPGRNIRGAEAQDGGSWRRTE